MNDLKKRVCVSIVAFSAVFMLRSCNSNLNKEKEPGVVVEPPKVEEIKFEDIFATLSEEERAKKVQEIIDNNSIITEESTQNRRK